MKHATMMVLSSLSLITGSATAVKASQPFTIATFEKSAVFKKYHLQEKDSWTLKTGGQNFSYIFDNPGLPGESMMLEMQGSRADIRRISLSWPGDLPVTRLDPHEATFLKEMISLFAPGQNSAPIIAYARANAGLQYDSGSAMPRKQFGALRVNAGQSTLLFVGLEK